MCRNTNNLVIETNKASNVFAAVDLWEATKFDFVSESKQTGRMRTLDVRNC